MLRPRLIVFLMLEDGYIKKSKLFSNSRYLGDPLNAVQIYSDLNVDELIILDVNATNHNKSPNYDLLKNIGSIARMPLCYGGGIKDISQIDKIIRCGIEKISISSEVFNNKELIKQASKKYGSQSIVCCIDTKLNKSTYEYEIFVNRGQLKVSSDIKNMINQTERPLIIFPQGTRVKPDERPLFKKGVGRVYEELSICCQPVAINSGHVWPKKGPKISNKQITI